MFVADWVPLASLLVSNYFAVLHSDESDYTVAKIAADAKSLLKKLNKSKEKPFVIGHDWGGMITWTLAYKYPELFDSVGPFPKRQFINVALFVLLARHIG
jgi:pimeloyl-ACP methyl ester carboxylesterase